MDIQAELFALADPAYKSFHAKLIPTIPPERIIGVRTPALRKFAKAIAKTPEAGAFLSQLPHIYYDENNLHAFLIADIPDFPICINQVERFLPQVDNWATCDSLRPKCFERNKADLLPRIPHWLTSPHAFTVRFGMEMLMLHFLEKDFDPLYPRWVAEATTDDYYVKMMAAWYFATALAFHWEDILPWMDEGMLPPWVRGKAIQKAMESYRITPEQKIILREIRRS